MSKKQKIIDKLTIIKPFDAHQHFRDDNRLSFISNLVIKQFNKAIVMPNLIPPVVNYKQANDYKKLIENSINKDELKKSKLDLLMTLYLTDNTTPKDIDEAVDSGIVYGVKMYPKNATTNSDAGVTDIKKVYPTLKQMAKHGLPLLVHGEVTDQNIDIFDREKVFIDTILKPLLNDIPNIKLVLEHITTKDAVEFIESTKSNNIAATITCHHLLYNRNAIFHKGIRPHMYCLPILKAEQHRLALVRAATSNNPKFFLGTDSALHEQGNKESECGCAGIFTAHAAMELYCETFENENALDKLENFSSIFGSKFYGLDIDKDDRITLVKEKWTVPKTYKLEDGKDIIALRSNEEIKWKVVNE